ncbi:MAG TPA: ferrous iron transport protein A [Clostridiales bacterium]|nr:ferrous iron transport protein A [Clostridiales bacterium]
MNQSYSSAHAVPLSDLPVGINARVLHLKATGLSRRRLLDLGLVPGTQVKILRKSPLGDPTAYEIRGASVALRKKDASNILVQPVKTC